MTKVNRVPENAQTVTHDAPQPPHLAEGGDQLLGLMPAPDQRRARADRADRVVRDDRDFPRERYPEPQTYGGYPPLPYEHVEQHAVPMAAHPLFRGLLEELPPRTDPPNAEFLESWLTTARSILELLYRPGSRH